MDGFELCEIFWEYLQRMGDQIIIFEGKNKYYGCDDNREFDFFLQDINSKLYDLKEELCNRTKYNLKYIDHTTVFALNKIEKFIGTMETEVDEKDLEAHIKRTLTNGIKLHNDLVKGFEEAEESLNR